MDACGTHVRTYVLTYYIVYVSIYKSEATRKKGDPVS